MENRTYDLEFKGEGKEYFSIFIVNWLFTIVTLGFYYPWAKAKVLKYMYSNTELEGHPFAFHGTGKEMFIGFIKGIILFGIIFGLYALALYMEQLVLGIIVLYAGILAILPLAIHGTLKYRLSRSSYRGVHFGYRGDRGELYGKFMKGFLFSILTLGFYSFWMQMDIRNYTMGNSRYGSSRFKFNGKGTDWFVLNLIGMLLTIVTLYIYVFKFYANAFNFMIDNMGWESDDGSIRFKGSARGRDVFMLLAGNALIILFTLGLGAPWAEVRMAKWMAENIHLDGDVDLDRITQTEADHLDATGDELLDMMDLDIFF